MGVPALFRWLNNKYPKIISRVVEEEVDEYTIDINLSKSNPNGFEIDNLYLDMNGIIHPCCHPEDEEAPPDEEAMFEKIFIYIDRIFSMVRPRRLLYMAIDGVAPRAKMNQQRSRRFRAAQEVIENKETEKKFKQTLLANESCQVLNGDPSWTQRLDFDSNCITPGTEFMTNLSVALRRYISQKLEEGLDGRSGWSKIQIILSDSSVPGEGEHKIMDFIRQQQAAPGYPPNLAHAIYGLDADLIMLALATHEVNFRVLREDVFTSQATPSNQCYRCGASGHHSSECSLIFKLEAKRPKLPKSDTTKPFIWLSVSTLREYLYYEFTWKKDKIPDFESLIDDWIFLIFFVGNDFLPHLPSLSIHEGAIDLLLDLYKRMLTSVNIENLTHRGNVNIPRVLSLLSELGSLEDKIFAQRKEKEEYFLKKSQPAASIPIEQPVPQLTIPTKKSLIATSLDLTPTALKAHTFDPNRLPVSSKRKHPNDEENTLYENEKNKHSSDSHKSISSTSEEKLNLNTCIENINESIPLNLWEAGAKDRYYLDKFQLASTDVEEKKKIVHSYLEGLIWVLSYYYTGCISWNWYYPFHYAPFASDFSLIVDEATKIEMTFEKGTPFRPFEQLLGVLPAASSSLLPKSHAQLMLDDNSPIIDFYPSKFKIDLNGKKHTWQGVALLPFIDEKRLLSISSTIPEAILSKDEVERNKFGSDLYFVGADHPCFESLKKYRNCENNESGSSELYLSLKTIPQGVEGIIKVSSNEIIYQNPYPEKPLSFLPSLLPGTTIPPRSVTFDDFRRAKFSKQSLRNSYSATLLHHHSMHKEYDEKVEVSYSTFKHEKGKNPDLYSYQQHSYHDSNTNRQHSYHDLNPYQKVPYPNYHNNQYYKSPHSNNADTSNMDKYTDPIYPQTIPPAHSNYHPDHMHQPMNSSYQFNTPHYNNYTQGHYHQQSLYQTAASSGSSINPYLQYNLNTNSSFSTSTEHYQEKKHFKTENSSKNGYNPFRSQYIPYQPPYDPNT